MRSVQVVDVVEVVEGQSRSQSGGPGVLGRQLRVRRPGALPSGQPDYAVSILRHLDILADHALR